MNDRRLNKILERVRAEQPPGVPDDFGARVMRRVRQDPGPRAISLSDQLEALFPRVAWAAAMIIALCVAGDVLLTATNLPDLAEGMARISGEWLFPIEFI